MLTRHVTRALAATRKLLPARHVTCARCSSESAAHEKVNEELGKKQILDASLRLVPQHGWSTASLEAGAELLGYPATAHGLFPRGGVELVFHFITQSNEQLNAMLDEQKQSEDSKKSTPIFVRDALQSRLEMILPYADNWHEAMALQTLPQNSIDSWRHLLQLSDDIWFQAGDKSTNMNWYTKRLSLAAVYKSSELCLLTDRSEDKQYTWSFLQRRLDDVRTVGGALASLGDMETHVKDNARGVLEMAQNMLGMNTRR